MAGEYSNLLSFLLTYPDNVDEIKNRKDYKQALRECREPFKGRLIAARKEYIEFMYKEKGDAEI